MSHQTRFQIALVVILCVALAVVLLFVAGSKAAGQEAEAYAAVPAVEFTPWPAPITWSPPALPSPISFPPTDPPPRPHPVPKPTPHPKPTPPNLSRSIRGTSTWYCLPSWPSACMAVHRSPAGMFAAAGPALRAAIGPAWRNRLVKVTSLRYGRSVWVRLADWCLCTGPAHPAIDLYSGPFAFLSGRPKTSPGGGLEVKISW